MEFKKHDLDYLSTKLQLHKGYMLVPYKEHPNCYCNGRYPFHRLVVENHIGRYLTPEEHVHHIDFDKQNNNKENLLICSNSEHQKIHAAHTKRQDRRCSCCNTVFYPNKATQVYCSVRCANSTKKEKALLTYIEKDILEMLVWIKPITTLAKELNVSTRTIVTTCDRLHITRPPQGYWNPNEVKKAMVNPPLPPKICPVCNNTFTPQREYTVYCSRPCVYRANERIVWPPREKLEKLVWEMPTSKLATYLGVSGKAIEKRCRKYGIDKPPRGYWQKRKNK
jgi:hypothetical protein